MYAYVRTQVTLTELSGYSTLEMSRAQLRHVSAIVHLRGEGIVVFAEPRRAGVHDLLPPKATGNRCDHS